MGFIMMKCIKHAVLIHIWWTGQVAFGDCILDRNEYNKYPWVLRLVVDKVMRCYGALVTPEFTISAYEPVKEMVDNNKLLTKLDFTGQLYGENGQMLCSATRQARKANRVWLGRPDLNLCLAHLKKGFEVTANNPFLVSKLEEYNLGVYNKKFAEVTMFECCVLPVFDSKTSRDPKIVEDTITFVKGPTEDYWKKVFCNSTKYRANLKNCDTWTTRDHFFAYDPKGEEREKDFDWNQGASIVCDGNPLGLLGMMVEDPSTSAKITVFQNIKHHSQYFASEAKKQWPNSPWRTTKKTGGGATGKKNGDGGDIKHRKKSEREPKSDSRIHDAARSLHSNANFFAIFMIIRALQNE